MGASGLGTSGLWESADFFFIRHRLWANSPTNSTEDPRIQSTHRPATGNRILSLDDLAQTLERDDALWSANAFSDVVRHQDSL